MAKLKKEKRNWKHIHKVRVHENRWLLWAVASTIIAASALIAYIQVSNVHFETQVGFNDPIVNSWTSFSNRVYGYTLRYPKSWAIEADSASGMSFVSPVDANEYFSVTVYPVSAERDVRTTLSSIDEEATVVAGMGAERLTLRNNRAENVILLKVDDDLFVLRGKSAAFDKIVESFKLQQKLERI